MKIVVRRSIALGGIDPTPEPVDAPVVPPSPKPSATPATSGGIEFGPFGPVVTSSEPFDVPYDIVADDVGVVFSGVGSFRWETTADGRSHLMLAAPLPKFEAARPMALRYLLIKLTLGHVRTTASCDLGGRWLRAGDTATFDFDGRPVATLTS